MIDQEELLRFYQEEFQEAYNRSQKKKPMPKYMHRINAKAASLSRMHLHPGMEKQGAQLHAEIRRLYFAAYSTSNKVARKRVRQELLRELLRADLELMEEEEAERMDEDFLLYVRKKRPGILCKKTINVVFLEYRREILTKEIVSLVPSRPEMEFPEALAMKRHFIIHAGPTNSGKTYQSLERLKKAKNGVYLGPLRLLALEVYERMMESGVPCTMLTGQECIEEEDSRVTASTVEMLDLDKEYDVAVIDEAQMLSDDLRGHSWTRAILGVRCPEIHVCMSPDAIPAVTHLIELCSDDYELRRYERKTPLELEEKPFTFPDDVREGDALIVFSKKAVLSVAGWLQEQNIESSVIYGSLPPEIRRRQMHMFNTGETKVVVSTDAIGMGLNLPVRRIVFMAVEKYDGRSQRRLTTSEILQIAGRAGRFGLYETGYVTALDEERLNFLKKEMPKEIPELTKVSLGFPQVLLSMDAPLDEILTLWKEEEPAPPFEKINIEDMLFLYREAYKRRILIADFEDKRILYKMVTCPIDIKDRELVALWNRYCTTYTADVSLSRPIKKSRYDGLARWESYYKKLDLYYQFSYRLGKWIDTDWLEEERERTQDKIMQQLAADKQDYILRCKYCGRVLPVDSPFLVCSRCYTRQRRGGEREILYGKKYHSPNSHRTNL